MPIADFDELYAELLANMPAAVWAHAKRELTQTAQSIASTVSSTAVSQVRGDTWEFNITDLTLDANKQQLVVKIIAKHLDANALLFFDSDDGLLILNGLALETEDQSKGSIVYSGTTLTVSLDADASALLPAGTWVFGIQSVTAGGDVTESYGGSFTVLEDVVRSVE